MADFTLRKRTTTSKSSVAVKGNLPVGQHVFQLTTVDENGNQSQAAKITVNIVRPFIFIDPRLRDPIIPDPVIPIIPIPIRIGPVDLN